MSKKWILIITFSLFCMICVEGFNIYFYSQPANALILSAKNVKGGSLTIKGEDVKIIEDIFLNEIEYVEENLFNEFPQSKSEYSVMCYPRNSEPEYEDFLLNFNLQDNSRKNEYVVFGNIHGGQNRHGYIRSGAYDDLSFIIKKYQNKK